MSLAECTLYWIIFLYTFIKGDVIKSSLFCFRLWFKFLKFWVLFVYNMYFDVTNKTILIYNVKKLIDYQTSIINHAQVVPNICQIFLVYVNINISTLMLLANRRWTGNLLKSYKFDFIYTNLATKLAKSYTSFIKLLFVLIRQLRQITIAFS